MWVWCWVLWEMPMWLTNEEMMGRLAGEFGRLERDGVDLDGIGGT